MGLCPVFSITEREARATFVLGVSEFSDPIKC
jgi:hypothetical protein